MGFELPTSDTQRRCSQPVLIKSNLEKDVFVKKVFRAKTEIKLDRRLMKMDDSDSFEKRLQRFSSSSFSFSSFFIEKKMTRTPSMEKMEEALVRDLLV